jgi:protein gp37
MKNTAGDWWSASINPIEGCTRCSEACRNCWCLAMLRRFRGLDEGEFLFYPNRLERVYKWKNPRRIFVGNMTDMFHPQILASDHGFDLVDDVFTVADTCPKHTFIYLTKRPQNVCEFLLKSRRGAFSHNEWIGITVENQARFDERWPHLRDIPASIKFLHLEPLLGPVDISSALPYVQWVVVGGENGPGARPMHPDWVRSIRDQCVAAGIPFWFKGLGSRVFIPGSSQNTGWILKPDKDEKRLLDGREWNELPEARK